MTKYHNLSTFQVHVIKGGICQTFRIKERQTSLIFGDVAQIKDDKKDYPVNLVQLTNAWMTSLFWGYTHNDVSSYFLALHTALLQKDRVTRVVE